MTKDNIIKVDFGKQNPAGKKVEYFDKVTFSITQDGKKEEGRTVCIVPEGVSKKSGEICETKAISRILLGKEEGEEFEGKIDREVTVFIENISKSKRQSKSKKVA